MLDSSWPAFIGTRHFSFRPPILFPWWRWWCFIAETCAVWRMSHAFDKYSRSPRPPYLSSEPRCLHLGLESRIISHKTAQGTCWPAALKLLYKISYLDKNHTNLCLLFCDIFSPEVLTDDCETDDCETWITLMEVCHVWYVGIGVVSSYESGNKQIILW